MDNLYTSQRQFYICFERDLKNIIMKFQLTLMGLENIVKEMRNACFSFSHYVF